MKFKPIQHGIKFIILFFILYVGMSTFLIFKSFERASNLYLILIILLLGIGMFILYVFIDNKVPLIRVEMDGIYFDKTFLGRNISSKKMINFESTAIKLTENEIRFYSLKRVKSNFKWYIITIVNIESASFFKKLSYLRIREYQQFVKEVFRRVKQAEIDRDSFNNAKKMGIPLGVNVRITEKKSKSPPSKVEEFISNYFKSKSN